MKRDLLNRPHIHGARPAAVVVDFVLDSAAGKSIIEWQPGIQLPKMKEHVYGVVVGLDESKSTIDNHFAYRTDHNVVSRKVK